MPFTPPATKLQVYPCSPTAAPNEVWTLQANGSLTSAHGGCLLVAPGGSELRLNATVWHTLNSSATAPGNYQGSSFFSKIVELRVIPR
jgi:hypothetical protein